MSHDRKKQVRCVCKTKYSSINRNTCPTCELPASKVPEKRKHDYDFWFCPTDKCTQPIFHTHEIEKKVAETLNTIAIPDEFIDWAMEYLETQVYEEGVSQQSQLEALHHADEQNEEQLRRLNQLYVRGGFEYDDGETAYKQQQSELLKKRNEIRAQKSKLTKYVDDWREETSSGYRFCKDAQEAFTSTEANHRTKRKIFSDLVEGAVVRGDKLDLEIQPPFMYVKDKLDTIKEKFELTEPAEIANLIAKNGNPELSEAIKLTWLRDQDVFRTRVL